ncbi:helix-turn-helix transcriptional regulator [Streptomyces sp. GbtcB6]|uniref:AraC family transcriptional regulator n=1 Tax=Streptomyces sp. GbtcB6 TaxID=2824751 RepID=UPI0020C6404E|nr:helix-turn-helix transcriptional regulator [Streptomyces sp. GbtcB6]
MAMVGMGQAPVIERGYRNPARPDLRMEVLTFTDLARRLPGDEFRRVHRLDFHHLTLVHSGEATGMVDFVDVPLRPGTLLYIRPGQVQRLPMTSGDAPADLDATVVLFTPDFPPRFSATARVTDDAFGPAYRLLGPDDHERFHRALADLAAEYTDLPEQDPEITKELLRQLLAALLLRIARLPASDGCAQAVTEEPYRLFRHELERSFAVLRQAHEYAARLGYSLKTLNRACQRATGHTAKQLVDDRVVLEAKRLLAHTDLPVAAVSDRLGFTEPTNFSKFFIRTTGLTPGAFRDTQH